MARLLWFDRVNLSDIQSSNASSWHFGSNYVEILSGCQVCCSFARWLLNSFDLCKCSCLYNCSHSILMCEICEISFWGSLLQGISFLRHLAASMWPLQGQCPVLQSTPGNSVSAWQTLERHEVLWTDQGGSQRAGRVCSGHLREVYPTFLFWNKLSGRVGMYS